MNILAEDRIIEIFCTVDDFCKEYSQELSTLPKLGESGKKHRNRPCEMSDSEIITDSYCITSEHLIILNIFPCIISVSICIKNFRMHFLTVVLFRQNAVFSHL
jgi:hypothetical protein